MIQSLKQKCMDVLKKDFGERPIHARQLQQPTLSSEFHSILPTCLDPVVTARYIEDEAYYRRACAEHYECSEHHLEIQGPLGWKSLFFQKRLEILLEKLSSPEDVEELVGGILDASSDHIHAIRLKSVPEGLDRVCSNLPNLSRLEIQCSAAECNPKHFGFNLGKAVAASRSLTSLSITNSRFTDDAVRAFATGLTDADDSLAPTVTNLNLSHNKIQSEGLKLLLQTFVDDELSVLTSLNLQGNRIDANGGRFLGESLRGNNALVSLHCGLNRLGDEGGRALLDGLLARDERCNRSALMELNLSSNGIGSGSAESLALVLGSSGTDVSELTSIDVSCNGLSGEDVARLADAMENNKHIICLDLRRNDGWSEGGSVANRIDFILHRNETSLLESQMG